MLNDEYIRYEYDAAGMLTRITRYEDVQVGSRTDKINKDSFGYSYDAESRLNGSSYSFKYALGTSSAVKNIYTSYDYNANGTLSSYSVTTDNNSSIANVTYSYDNYLRPTGKTVTATGFTNAVEYEYTVEGNVLTGEIEYYCSNVNNNNTEYNYTYDDRGYITSITKENSLLFAYEYDAQGQLTVEYNYYDEWCCYYYYDLDGNLTTISYTTLDGSEYLDAYAFTYTDDAVWGNRLTSAFGSSVTYDSYGRTTSYLGKSISYFYETDRFYRIASIDGISFTYYENDLRRTKTVSGVTHYYTYEGINLVKEEWNGNVMLFLYDADGSVIGMQYRNSSYASGVWDTYYYEKNLQGDIIAIYDTNGNKVVSYRYLNAWGQCIPTYYSSSSTARYNPFRYRGYYYDDDLDLYYLSTRYYDSQTCRFITMDDISYLGANGDLVSYNLFAYCSNNPVMYVDPTGHSIVAILIILAVGFVAGGVVGGIVSHNNGNEGWDLIKD